MLMKNCINIFPDTRLILENGTWAKKNAAKIQNFIKC